MEESKNRIGADGGWETNHNQAHQLLNVTWHSHGVAVFCFLVKCRRINISAVWGVCPGYSAHYAPSQVARVQGFSGSAPGIISGLCYVTLLARLTNIQTRTTQSSSKTDDSNSDDRR